MQHMQILVAIETDSTRYHGEFATRPRLLEGAPAEQMLAHLAADLVGMFPGLGACALTMPGALFDQTQLLRPGFPVFGALEGLLLESLPDQAFQPRQLSLPVEDGRMPHAALQPEQDIPLGLLQCIPLLVSGEPATLGPIAREMEHRFLDSGQLSAHSAKALEVHFGIGVQHARFMTLTDLQALLRLQLEHFGFLALWELLDAALSDRPEPLEAIGRGGQSFCWREGAVHARFETFDHWAATGAGAGEPAIKNQLARAYADWTREYRQYLTTLQAHAVTVLQHLPGRDAEALAGTFLVEKSAQAPSRDTAPVTEHSAGDLGSIAVTVIDAGQQHNYYPLTPAGLNALHAAIREQGLAAGGVAFPGGIRYDERSRRLVGDSLGQ
ncbi:MAG: hypothetical protein GTN56_09505 [Xanthomonadales bacterium]|nr:hypothetical protein [Xanthomonadales bacterium]NIN75386.1 hypothetical protein [Xanthomonadales bacterium]NIP12411.1 hypothetical protein [Xanthomonadales bacterium]NIT34092.1 hypothetical protein [Xanthomonadales bacterium]